jgi:hypothetical protein
MRKRQTFLLTILGSENDTASFCGRVKVIASGKTYNFTSIDELHHLIVDEMGENVDLQNILPHDHTLKFIKSSGSAS